MPARHDSGANRAQQQLLQAARVRCCDLDLDTGSHAASSHGTNSMEIPQMDSFVPINPLAWNGEEGRYRSRRQGKSAFALQQQAVALFP